VGKFVSYFIMPEDNENTLLAAKSVLKGESHFCGKFDGSAP
jgi:hypothetical protein